MSGDDQINDGQGEGGGEGKKGWEKGTPLFHRENRVCEWMATSSLTLKRKVEYNRCI